MNYTTKAVETRYKGHLFRSRLEATWAAFFDICGWPWEYEPFELHGWLPDFILFGKTKVLVEVKPIVEFPRDVADKISKASKNFSDMELLILGCSVIEYDSSTSCIGWLYEKNHEHDSGFGEWWSEAALIHACNMIDFAHVEGSWHGRMSGFYDGSIYFDFEEAKSMFGHAKEITRYIHKH